MITAETATSTLWATTKAFAHLARAYLGAKGVAYLGIGLTWLLVPSEGRVAGLQWLAFVSPMAVGWVWTLTGALAVAMAHFVEPKKCATPGWLALILPPTLFGMWFLVAWVQYQIIGTGAARGIATTAPYWGMAVGAVLMARTSVLVHRILPEVDTDSAGEER